MGNAINGTGYGLTVLPFYDNFWGGVWSGASYSSGTGLTTFTGNFGTPVGGGALGDSIKPGMVVIPDLLKAVPLHIESVSINLLGSDTLTVKGDATGLGGSGTRFRIHQHAPYKYDLTDEVKRNNPCDLGSRYLWSSYRRIPWTWSRAGEDPYLAWNRVYLPEIGRWTSADVLGSPWTSLFAYTRSPAHRRDQSGLDEQKNRETYENTYGIAAAKKAATMKAADGIDGKSFKASGCLGKEGCDVTFTFKQFYLGSWNYLGNEQKGAHVEMTASFDQDKCCKCDEVKLIQVVRAFKKSGAKGDADRAIETAEPDTPLRKARSGWDDKDAKSRGWRVDAQGKGSDPYNWIGLFGNHGSAGVSAMLRDSP